MLCCCDVVHMQLGKVGLVGLVEAVGLVGLVGVITYIPVSSSKSMSSNRTYACSCVCVY
jgi:hypothetical protein